MDPRFLLPSPAPVMLARFNALFNAYCRWTRPGHVERDFMTAETSRDAEVAAIELQVFVAGDGVAAPLGEAARARA